MTRRCTVFAILAVLWCVMIFMLSGQVADDSSETSGFFVDMICDIFLPDADAVGSTRYEELKDTVTVIVRKGAHFTAYGVLGMLTFGALGFIKNRKPRAGAAVGFAGLYACSDEIHQTFVQGRSGEVIDVLIDTCGALLFVALVLLILHLLDVRRQKDES